MICVRLRENILVYSAQFGQLQNSCCMLCPLDHETTQARANAQQAKAKAAALKAAGGPPPPKLGFGALSGPSPLGTSGQDVVMDDGSGSA